MVGEPLPRDEMVSNLRELETALKRDLEYIQRQRKNLEKGEIEPQDATDSVEERGLRIEEL